MTSLSVALCLLSMIAGCGSAPLPAERSAPLSDATESTPAEQGGTRPGPRSSAPPPDAEFSLQIEAPPDTPTDEWWNKVTEALAKEFPDLGAKAGSWKRDTLVVHYFKPFAANGQEILRLRQPDVPIGGFTQAKEADFTIKFRGAGPPNGWQKPAMLKAPGAELDITFGPAGPLCQGASVSYEFEGKENQPIDEPTLWSNLKLGSAPAEYCPPSHVLRARFRNKNKEQRGCDTPTRLSAEYWRRDADGATLAEVSLSFSQCAPTKKQLDDNAGKLRTAMGTRASTAIPFKTKTEWAKECGAP